VFDGAIVYGERLAAADGGIIANARDTCQAREVALKGDCIDSAMRRHVVPAFLDFDYRANALRLEINPAWEEKVRELHRENGEQLIAGLKEEYGGAKLEQKVADFAAAGPFVSSLVAVVAAAATSNSTAAPEAKSQETGASSACQSAAGAAAQFRI
jgi:hypothetical protein